MGPVLRRRLVVTGAAAAALLLALVVWKRQDRRPPRVAPDPRLVAASRAGRPVFFLGLDGVDWPLLDRHLATGKMPNLAALAREGVLGDLESQRPLLSPLVWTTMMTGQTPLEHGILDFTRRNPKDGREEPITSDERRGPAIWTMATAAGRSSVVVGLWATYPAEPVNGLLVSDRFVPSLLRRPTEAPGTVFPEERVASAEAARKRAEAAVGFGEVRAYLPWLAPGEWAAIAGAGDPYRHPPTALRRILVETRLAHDLGREAVRDLRPDLAVVYFEGTDAIGHFFAPYAPPRRPSVPAEDFERYGPVAERYFRDVDVLLGEWRELAKARGAILFLASDHGFAWDEGRPRRLSAFAPATASEWHRPDGMYLLAGPGIVSGGGRRRGSVMQVTETLLALLGLPPATDRPPLPGVARDTRPPFPYASLPVPRGATAEAASDSEALERLRALGYVGTARPPGDGDPGSTRTPSSWANECLIRRANAADEARALAAAERALVLDDGHAVALWCRSELVFAKGDLALADAVLVRAVAAGLPDGMRHLAARAEAHRKEGRTGAARKLLDDAVAARPGDDEARALRGSFAVSVADAELRAGRAREALRLLEDAWRDLGPNPHGNLHYLRGEALARLDRGREAEAAFREEIRLFPGNLAAYPRLALVMALLRRSRAEVREVLEAMYAQAPTASTAGLAARTLRAVGDEDGARGFDTRAP